MYFGAIYDFLLLINTNLPQILHCFGDTAFQIWKIAFLATPLAFKPPTQGLPWDDPRKIVRGCQYMAKVPRYQTAKKNC